MLHFLTAFQRNVCNIVERLEEKSVCNIVEKFGENRTASSKSTACQTSRGGVTWREEESRERRAKTKVIEGLPHEGGN